MCRGGETATDDLTGATRDFTEAPDATTISNGANATTTGSIQRIIIRIVLEDGGGRNPAEKSNSGVLHPH
jgi:hypothetical protein